MAILGVSGVPTTADQFLLNKRMNKVGEEVQLGDKIFCAKQSFVGKYDFDVQGGAIGTVYLDDSKGEDLRLPDNFVITNVIIDKVTSIQSADSGADISLGQGTAADLLTSTAETSIDGTGLVAGTPVGTAATAVKMSSENRIGLNIATSALTAGKWYVQLEGFQSESF